MTPSAGVWLLGAAGFLKDAPRPASWVEGLQVLRDDTPGTADAGPGWRREVAGGCQAASAGVMNPPPGSRPPQPLHLSSGVLALRCPRPGGRPLRPERGRGWEGAREAGKPGCGSLRASAPSRWGVQGQSPSSVDRRGGTRPRPHTRTLPWADGGQLTDWKTGFSAARRGCSRAGWRTSGREPQDPQQGPQPSVALSPAVTGQSLEI